MTATVQQIIEKAPKLTELKAEKALRFIIELENEPDENDKEFQARLDKVRKAGGGLHKYADPSKWSLEEGAFERAVVENYEAD